MVKYKYILTFSDGRKFDSLEEYSDEGIFNTYNAAEEAALYAIGCMRQGVEILNMSNPGDYDYDEENFESPEYEIVEIEENI
jgi:hypothetical protein